MNKQVTITITFGLKIRLPVKVENIKRITNKCICLCKCNYLDIIQF